MRQEGILAGVDLSAWFPELSDCLLVCATETKTDEDIQTYVQSLREHVEAARTTG
jgi:glycine dehydrogenase subunit 1